MPDPIRFFWFIPTHGDGSYLGSSTGERQPDFPYFRQIAQAADRLGYEGAHWQEQPSGALGLADALVTIDCRLDEAIERHSHAILIGQVNNVTLRPEAEPLLYWHGAYRLLSGLDRVLTQA